MLTTRKVARYISVIRDFRFRVQRVIVNRKRRFQLRVGMYGERDLEFIPVHQTAFAQLIPLQESHPTEEDATREQDALMEWLKSGETAGHSHEGLSKFRLP